MKIKVDYSKQEMIFIKNATNFLGELPIKKSPIPMIAISLGVSLALFIFLRHVGGVFNIGYSSRSIGGIVSFLPVVIIMPLYTYSTLNHCRNMSLLYKSRPTFWFEGNTISFPNKEKYLDISAAIYFTDRILNDSYIIFVSGEPRFLFAKRSFEIIRNIEEQGIRVIETHDQHDLKRIIEDETGLQSDIVVKEQEKFIRAHRRWKWR